MNKYLAESLTFLRGLDKAGVEYIIIGGVAVNIHGFQRATGDLDIWFNPTKENFRQLLAAFVDLGYDISEFANSKKPLSEIVIRLPLDSFSIELLPFLDGKGDFPSIRQRADFLLIEGVSIPVISYDDLIASKANVHRAKDLEDIAQLERRRQQGAKKKDSEKKGFDSGIDR